MLKDRIKKIREHFGLSQAQFAQRINKSPGLISLIETGRTNISEETIKQICSVFFVNESWLISGEGDMTSLNPFDKDNIGLRIRQIRKDNKLSQETLARKVGYCHQQICCIEKGRTKPSNELLLKISSLFNVNIEWLMTGTGEMYKESLDIVDDKLIEWLNNHPEVIRELRQRSGIV